jgi:hypothetical protein
MLTHVPHGQGGLTNERKMEPDASLKDNIESQTTHALDSRRNIMNRRFFSSKAGGGEPKESFKTCITQVYFLGLKVLLSPHT